MTRAAYLDREGKVWTEDSRQLDVVYLTNEWGEIKAVTWAELKRDWVRA